MRLEDFERQRKAGDLWIFGYGSLMWSPGFAYKEKALARVHGYHRALCILSTRYRGTLRKPGLVMGLCRGGSCWGMAYRVDARAVHRTLVRLWNREMRRRVYHSCMVRTRLGRRDVRALAFVADPGHPAYVRELDPTAAPGWSPRASASAGIAWTTSGTRSITCTASACAIRISSASCTPRSPCAALRPERSRRACGAAPPRGASAACRN
jgi:cation transport protein ChaC